MTERSFGDGTHDEGSFRKDDDLEWLLVAGGSAMGERGTLAGVVSVLELGGGNHGGIPNTDFYSDQQVGWRTTVVGLVERHRWLLGAWVTLPRDTQAVLLACYTAPRAQYRTDQGFGARDVCPPVEAIQRGATPEPQRGRHQETRTGVEAQLGEMAALAFQLTESPAKLLQACQQPSKGKNGRTIRSALRQSRTAAKEAHRAWTAAKATASKPRHWSERKAILPAHNRTEARAADEREVGR